MLDDTLATPAAAVDHDAMANALRALAMDAVERAQSGHPGMPMGMADVATVLFRDFLDFDPSYSDWPDRDRFVLSAGHGSMLLYAALHLTGYADITLDEMKRFRQLGSRTAGHPEHGRAAGIETTTGPLGQGLANAVGMAIAERLLAERYGSALVDHYTYAIVGDGCLMEGISHEAISLAGHLGLGKLIILFDDNRISIDGPTDLAVSDDQAARFRASGWDVQSVDGHDPDAVARAIEAARAAPQPSLIACRTVIGYGAPTKAGTAATHGSPLGATEVAGARVTLGWPHAPFEVPEAIRAAWRAAADRGSERRQRWSDALGTLPETERRAFLAAVSGDLPEGWDAPLAAFKRRLSEERPSWATRKSSQEALEVLTASLPQLIGGSADLTGSNNTKTKATPAISAASFAGRYVHYGVREHAMAAAMNGMALHGGVIPYGGTFLAFSDYCRPAIRLSALMRQRVVYVMTHDSIGLGEDGPTHQPVEHLASLRAIPNLHVFRPADAVETAECWALAVAATETPSLLALTRQALPTVRTKHMDNNPCARGAYVLAEADGVRRVTLLASGSEVEIALRARELLQDDWIPTAVVSMPCWDLFEAQDERYRHAVLRPDTKRIAVEAASPFGWTRYVDSEADVIGMRSFGDSGPAEDLYAHFGITAEAVAGAARRRSGSLRPVF